MSKFYYFPLVIIVLIIAGGADVKTKQYQYEELQQQDISGDKIKETVKIKGKFLDDKSLNLKNITVDITFSESPKRKKLLLGSGMKPQLSFIDLNNDGVKDLFVTIYKDKAIKGYGYTLHDGQLLELKALKPIETETRFTNNYQAEIIIANKKYTLDLKSHKKEYDDLGIYHNGKLNEPIELVIEDYSSLTKAYELQGNGLSGIQKVYGIDKEDFLGEILTFWIYKDGNWNLQSVSFRKG